MIKIVCISDTHRQHRAMTTDITSGDIFIFAGDAEIDTFRALKDFNGWLGELNFKFKIFVAGNHDDYLQKLSTEEKQLFFSNAIYLENSSCKVMGINFWGSPYSPIFNDWAFMLNGKMLKKTWDLIPKKTDIVITHCPPFGILDSTPFSKWPCGCEHLLNRLAIVKPKFHVFGHIHNDAGTFQFEDNTTTFLNCSMLDDHYNYVNEPRIIYYEK